MNKLLKLERFKLFSRKEVQELFDPTGLYYPGAGKWGLSGIVRVPNSNDFVFFVTYGREISGHKFDEGITEDGILHWQSQPRQRLDDGIIKQFINHDHFVNNIFLFLRPDKKSKYFYLGKLAYASHDQNRQQPVYFKWQILDWFFPKEMIEEIGLKVKSENRETNFDKGKELDLKKSPNLFSLERGSKKNKFKEEKKLSEYRKNNLREKRPKDLAGKGGHKSQILDDGIGIENSLDTETKEKMELLEKREKNTTEKVEILDRSTKKLKLIVFYSLVLIAIGFLIGLITFR